MQCWTLDQCARCLIQCWLIWQLPIVPHRGSSPVAVLSCGESRRGSTGQSSTCSACSCRAVLVSEAPRGRGCSRRSQAFPCQSEPRLWRSRDGRFSLEPVGIEWEQNLEINLHLITQKRRKFRNMYNECNRIAKKKKRFFLISQIFFYKKDNIRVLLSVFFFQ